MKIIAVIGSRDFTDYKLLTKYLNHFLSKTPPNEIQFISGGAKGADTLAEIYAKEHDIPITIILPNWSLYGRSAGFRRNHDIIAKATHVIAFQVNKSKGTQHSIDLAKQLKLPVRIVEITQ